MLYSIIMTLGIYKICLIIATNATKGPRWDHLAAILSFEWFFKKCNMNNYAACTQGTKHGKQWPIWLWCDVITLRRYGAAIRVVKVYFCGLLDKIIHRTMTSKNSNIQYPLKDSASQWPVLDLQTIISNTLKVKCRCQKAKVTGL